jgi:catechol 2,3-dioxygenase-like lactoylglutathione lyase family enzyme
MAVQLNHTIVWCRDQQRSATFLAHILGRPDPVRFGPFLVVQLDNAASLDFYQQGEVQLQHYAFLVGETEFDAIFGRIRAAGISYWADPMRNEPGAINHYHGGRGVYFEDADGHFLELLTRPYPVGQPAVS